jgi:hypothetical protein
MRKYFRVGGRRFNVFTNPDHHWIAMDRCEEVYTYALRPQRDTDDEDIMWCCCNNGCINESELGQVTISQNAERAMKKVGWRRSLRRLRER